MDNAAIYEKAHDVLRKLYGEGATFRDGQYEAIEAALTRPRTLVVQKTGWGKSLVYFISAQLLKEMNRGCTIVVSPLLVLMDNQLDAAQKLGLRCCVLNSRVKKEERAEILKSIAHGYIDIIFVTPENLFKDDTQLTIRQSKIGMFVIDEVHCISDWGHDFRLEYGNLYKVLQMLPESVSVLGTTATANDRVIDDLKRQIGEDLFISRGPLTRESLNIQVLHIEEKRLRYAWILEHLNELPGSGIIYCLTQRDCEYLADFLRKNGVNVMPYHAGLDEVQQSFVEEAFKNNEIKAVVATIKLGMGYDKGDIGFVIHYQRPGNIVSYYQQIGRAGRNIPSADVILMSGKEDDDISNYFINTAFPSGDECRDVLSAIERNNGCKVGMINNAVNFRKNRIDKALNFLANEGYVFRDKSNYYRTPKKFVYDSQHYYEVTEIRKKELKQIQELSNQTGCYSKYIVNCLDDRTAEECGKCSNCLGRPIISEEISTDSIERATNYIEKLILPIEPRKQLMLGGAVSRIILTNEEGICLSRYGEAGYGALVARDKYSKGERFCDELIGKSAEVLRPIVVSRELEAIVFVPSVRSTIVEKFASELSDRLNIPVVKALEKKKAPQQKTMENSQHQCMNAWNSFFVNDAVEIPRRILLIDDVVDSRWTLTVCGYKLMERGCFVVFPFALADSGTREV